MFEVKIVGDQLILSEWRVIATCVGIELETGGTMTVTVDVDPKLSLDPPLKMPTEAEVRKQVLDPQMVKLVMLRLKPRVEMSADTKQILNLTFSSRGRAPYFDWVLDLGMDRLTQGGRAAVEMMGHPDKRAIALLRLLILNLGRLPSWSNVNRQNFSAYRLLVKSAVAQELSLAGEQIDDADGRNVVIFKERLA